jgi:hypothetical protein
MPNREELLEWLDNLILDVKYAFELGNRPAIEDDDVETLKSIRDLIDPPDEEEKPGKPDTSDDLYDRDKDDEMTEGRKP